MKCRDEYVRAVVESALRSLRLLGIAGDIRRWLRLSTDRRIRLRETTPNYVAKNVHKLGREKDNQLVRD
jgi:hypothetical protein